MNSDLEVKSKFFSCKLVSDSLDDPFLLTEWTTLKLGLKFICEKNLTKMVSNLSLRHPSRHTAVVEGMIAGPPNYCAVFTAFSVALTLK